MPTFEFSGEIAGAPKEDLFDNLGAKIKVVGVGGACLLYTSDAADE